MNAFYRVDARRAGPSALGFLVPPGSSSVVIVRPRSVPWDLLPLRPGCEQMEPAVFCTQERNAAAELAKRLQQVLEHGSGEAVKPIEVVATRPGRGFGVCVRAADLLWI